MTELFRDPAQPLAVRVADLLGQLTRAEKLGLLHQYQAAVPRLGIGPWKTGTEALHGLAWLGVATVFPQAVGLASTWNPELVGAVGAAVGAEVRALHHKDPDRVGLNVWAPVVNPLRDPRWGRNEEGYAEDPWLTATIATAYAGGLRGDHPRYLRTAPTLKHFLGYNNETDRHTTSSTLPPRVVREYDLPPFLGPLRAGAAVAVMAAYNLVNGRPAHLNRLIGDELRPAARGGLMVVGDAMAVSTIAGAQGHLPDHPSGYAAALRAGIDSFTEDDADPAPTIDRLTTALDRGLLDESDVDTAVRHLLRIRFRLGEFDPPDANPYAATSTDVINCPAHQELARAAARGSIVLLRNDGLLPLDPAIPRRVAVLGPLADTLHLDWYSGSLPYGITARTGLATRLGAHAVTHHEGVDRIALRTDGGRVSVPAGDAPLRVDPAGDDATVHFDLFDWGDGAMALRAVATGRHVTVDPTGALRATSDGPGGWVVNETFRLEDAGPDGARLRHLATGGYVRIAPDGELRADADAAGAAPFVPELVVDGPTAAATVARAADIAVVVVGNHPMVSGRETEDRIDLALPGDQAALVHAVAAANPRTVLVVASGYPYALDETAANLPAVLWSAHGGQEYGTALAEVLLGDVDPAGRLTQTWYRSEADLPDLLDYDIISADATYQYFRGSPLFPFGFGLSYTTFDYADLRLSAPTVEPDGTVGVRVEVTNTGTRDGVEVVQLYTRQTRSRVKQPLRRLRDFRRVVLAAGERRTVEFVLRAADLAVWDVTSDRFHLEAAPHQVMVGGSATDARLTAPLWVAGTGIPPRDPGRPLPAANHDESAGTTLTCATPQAGDAVAACEPGGWLAFYDVDFSAAPTGCAVTVARADAGPATVTLRLDDPLNGPVLATVATERPADPYAWATRTAPLDVPPDAGRRDLYVVLGEPGTRLRELTFTPPSAVTR